MGQIISFIFKTYFITFLIGVSIGVGCIFWYISQCNLYNNGQVLISKKIDKNLIKFENDKIIITIKH